MTLPLTPSQTAGPFFAIGLHEVLDMWIGQSEKNLHAVFDEAKLKILPAGSFYSEPANLPHLIEVKEDTVLQVSGMGPSGRTFMERPKP